jgi:hypothetical protein
LDGASRLRWPRRIVVSMTSLRNRLAAAPSPSSPVRSRPSQALVKLKVTKSPFPGKVKDELVTEWARPSLVAEVKFAEWTSTGELRQPVHLGSEPTSLRRTLAEFKKYDSQAEAKRNVVATIEKVTKQLGNTPAICRKSYVHPEILSAYMSGDLAKMIAQKFKRQNAKLTADEIMVLAFLRGRLKPLKTSA